MKEGNLSVNCVQAVLTIPLQYSDYVLRFRDGSQWEYSKTAKMESAGLLRWGQSVSLHSKLKTITAQLIGSSESSIQIVINFKI